MKWSTVCEIGQKRERNYKKADKQSERKERGLINRAKDERKLMNIRGRKKNEKWLGGRREGERRLGLEEVDGRKEACRNSIYV